ncbi:alpha/beta fold hydrolase [Streptomyces sp. NPDC055109]
MTAFILVAGAHTGGWIWQKVAARLRESGAEVHPVTLSGMGEQASAAGPETDPETHVRDLLRLIDQMDAAEVVMVGHCYGMYPVLGAADLRPERIARIVSIDAGMPQDGDQALSLLPEPALCERLLGPSGADGDEWRVSPPPLDEWHRWGSVEGLSPAELSRLADRAVAQPARTLTPAPPVGSGLRAAGDRCSLHRQRLQHRHGGRPGGPRRSPLSDALRSAGELPRTRHRALADAVPRR